MYGVTSRGLDQSVLTGRGGGGGEWGAGVVPPIRPGLNINLRNKFVGGQTGGAGQTSSTGLVLKIER